MIKKELVSINERLKLIERKIEDITEDLSSNELVIKERNCCVSKVRNNQKEFFMVTDMDATDVISEQARKGSLMMDPWLSSVFHQESGCLLDLGANIGVVSLAFASKGWKSYAFEASVKNASNLVKSAVLNDFDISVVCKAVYERTGEIYFVQNGPWGFIRNEVYNEINYEKIECVCLNDFVDEIQENKIDLIKIDVEGSEVAAIRGGGYFLEKFNFPPIYSEVNAFALALQGETPLSYFREVEKMGYKVYEMWEDKLFLYDIERFPINFNRDYVFLRDIPKEISEKVFGGLGENENETYEYILNTLRNWRRWENLESYGHEKAAEEYGSYICYCLKDFPKYNEDKEIRKLLSEIKCENKSEIIKNNLQWYNIV